MIWSIVVILSIVVCWYWYEGRWDRILFTDLPNCCCANLKAHEAKKWLRDHQDTQVIDVRSAAEFQKGALPKAINISLGAPDFESKVSALKKDQALLVYCAGGYRSRKAVEVLKHLGFKKILHIHRGYMSWRRGEI